MVKLKGQQEFKYASTGPAEREARLYELKIKRDQLKEGLHNSKTARYTELITAHGKFKGDLKHLTPKQYERFTGRKPHPGIMKGKHIPWENILDQLATQAGCRNEEEMKDKIMQDREYQKELRLVTSEIKALKSERGKPVKIEIYKLTGTPPVFPKDGESKEKVAQVGDMELKSRRNPSFYQVESDTTPGDGKPDAAFRVRYAKEADQLMREAAKSYQLEQRGISRKTRRISPRVPKLR